MNYCNVDTCETVAGDIILYILYHRTAWPILCMYHLTNEANCREILHFQYQSFSYLSETLVICLELEAFQTIVAVGNFIFKNLKFGSHTKKYGTDFTAAHK